MRRSSLSSCKQFRLCQVLPAWKTSAWHDLLWLTSTGTQMRTWALPHDGFVEGLIRISGLSCTPAVSCKPKCELPCSEAKKMHFWCSWASFYVLAFLKLQMCKKTDLKTLEVWCESNWTRGTTCPWIIWSFEYVIPSNFRFVTCNLYWNGDIMHDGAKCRICSCERNVNNTFSFGNLIVFFWLVEEMKMTHHCPQGSTSSYRYVSPFH